MTNHTRETPSSAMLHPLRPMEETLQPSLTYRTTIAIVWRFAGVGAQLLIQTTVMVFLARLLSVEDFGLAAQAMIVVGLASVISECGMAQAIIQTTELTTITIRSANTLSVLVGFLLACLLFATAEICANFVGAPSVAPMIRVVSLTFFFGGFGTTSGALLQRSLNFKQLALTEFLSYCFGYCTVVLPLALWGFGVWSLIYALVFQSFTKSALLLYSSPHSLRLCISHESRRLLRFGIGMLFSRIANFLAHNGDYFVVGRWLGTYALGFYSRAYLLMSLPVRNISNVLSTVLFSSYSSLQLDRRRLARAYVGSVSILSLIIFPIMASFCIVAPQLIRGLFGEKWMPVTIPFQILCLAGGMKSMTNAGDAVTRAIGNVYGQACCHAAYAFNVLVGAYLGSYGGTEGVSIGVVGAVVVHYVLIGQLSLRLVELGWREYLGAQVPGLLVTAAVTMVSWCLSHVLIVVQTPDILIVVCLFAALPVTWVIVVYYLPTRLLNDFTLSQIGRIKAMSGRLLDKRRRALKIVNPTNLPT